MRPDEQSVQVPEAGRYKSGTWTLVTLEDWISITLKLIQMYRNLSSSLRSDDVRFAHVG